MPQQNLSLERVFETAEELMRHGGIEAISLRKLANCLDVTPMALYRYVDSKEALLSGLLDRFAQRSQVLPAADLCWDRYLEFVAVAMWRALVDEPDWIALIGTLGLQPGTLEVFASCTDVLQQAGFDREQAVDGFFAMLHVVMGAANLTVASRKAQARGLTRFAAFDEDGSAVPYPPPHAPQFSERGLRVSLGLVVAGLKVQLYRVEVAAELEVSCYES